MKILHLCASYMYTDLYMNLLKELNKTGLYQTVYVPAEKHDLNSDRIISNSENINYLFGRPYNKIDKFIYYTKIEKIYKQLKSQIDFKEIDTIHAHFLFSDGGIAYKINKEYNTDYIVAVRNSDINFFFKYGLHVRKRGVEILKNAKKVVFITPSYQKKLLDKYIPQSLKEEINNKSIVIPNGIDEFWLDNKQNNLDKKTTSTLNILFIGELNKNKNVATSIKAIKELTVRGYKVHFDIIGTGEEKEKLKLLAEQLNIENIVEFHGYIKDRKVLHSFFQQANVFLMVSFKETFGLVYIEALSQGVPVIYTKCQGIDGYFVEGEVGFAVKPTSINQVVDSIVKISKNQSHYEYKAKEKLDYFRWKNIAKEYKKIYLE